MTRIKICGITNYDDAIEAVKFGCDALGFIFANSPRQVDTETAKDICLKLPPYVNKVGVFVNQSKSEIIKTAQSCGLDTIQLHDRSISFNRDDLTIPIVRAYKAKSIDVVEQIRKDKCQSFLLDSYLPGKDGGTGETFDWAIAKEASKLGNLILAGGLNHENVADALEIVMPYAVDVSSGVEETPGKKDHIKMRQFIDEVRKWDNRIN